jgi:hypothetical protein
MTKIDSTPESATLVAVDIAKQHNEVLIEAPAPARRRRFRVANELADYERLAEYLRQLGPRTVAGSRPPATIIARWLTFSSVRAASCG